MQNLFLKSSNGLSSLQQQSAITIPIGGTRSNYGNSGGVGNRKDTSQKFYLSSQKRRLQGLLTKLEK